LLHQERLAYKEGSPQQIFSDIAIQMLEEKAAREEQPQQKLPPFLSGAQTTTTLSVKGNKNNKNKKTRKTKRRYT
jgi:hypothetical protein